MPTTNLWLSEDPGKAWAERFFLLYTPVWIAAVGLVMATGALLRWGDLGFLAFAIAVSAPLIVIPAACHRRVPALAATPWHRSYWFKLNLWIFLFVWIGTYFLTHYFFDVLGMRYAFPTRYTLDAALVGRGSGSVPVFIARRIGSFIQPDGADHWHYVAMVRYRSRRDFLRFALAIEAGEISMHKWAALEKTHVFPVRPLVSLVLVRCTVGVLLALPCALLALLLH